MSWKRFWLTWGLLLMGLGWSFQQIERAYLAWLPLNRPVINLPAPGEPGDLPGDLPPH